MTEKPTGKEIRDAVEHWRIALGYDDWTYSIRIGRMLEGEWGEADVDLPYKKVRFRFYPKGMAEEQETVDEMVGHEWGHVPVQALVDYALSLCRTDAQRQMLSYFEETAATNVGRLITRLHRRPRA